MEDFRKVAIHLATTVASQPIIEEFFNECVTKFGILKVREFMEI